MAKKPTRPSNEDAEQSKRFIDTAQDMEAAGELDTTESAANFERAFRLIVLPKGRAT